MQPSELQNALGRAMNEASQGVLEYVEPEHVDYDTLLEYERKEMVARAQKVLEALAQYYHLDVEGMLALLEAQCNK